MFREHRGPAANVPASRKGAMTAAARVAHTDSREGRPSGRSRPLKRRPSTSRDRPGGNRPWRKEPLFRGAGQPQHRR